jgi:bifunctional DNase/RNase
MIEVQLSKIKIDENRSEQVIVLKEKQGHRFLPVVIGIAEVNAIKMKLSGVEPPRPLTHDLLMSVISAVDAELEKIVIDRLENNTFFAKLCVKTKDAKSVEVDARPSDSIAIALRANVPIFVDERVLDEAGISDN